MNFKEQLYLIHKADEDYKIYKEHVQAFYERALVTLNQGQLKTHIEVTETFIEVTENLEKIELSFIGRTFRISSDLLTRPTSEPVGMHFSLVERIKDDEEKLHKIATVYIDRKAVVSESIDKPGQFSVHDQSEIDKLLVEWVFKSIST